MRKDRIQVKCDSCATAVTWSGLDGGAFDVDLALELLGWTVYGQGQHKCPACTERAARGVPWALDLDLAALRDLDLSELGV